MLLFLSLLLESMWSIQFRFIQGMMILFFCGCIPSPNNFFSNYGVPHCLGISLNQLKITCIDRNVTEYYLETQNFEINFTRITSMMFFFSTFYILPLCLTMNMSHCRFLWGIVSYRGADLSRVHEIQIFIKACLWQQVYMELSS